MADYTTGRERGSRTGLWIAGGVVVLLVVIFSLFASGNGGTAINDPAYAPAAADPVEGTPPPVVE